MRMRTRPARSASHGAGRAPGSNATSGADRAATASRGRANGTTLPTPITGAAAASSASRVTPGSSGAGLAAGMMSTRLGLLPVIGRGRARVPSRKLYRDRERRDQRHEVVARPPTGKPTDAGKPTELVAPAL